MGFFRSGRSMWSLWVRAGRCRREDLTPGETGENLRRDEANIIRGRGCPQKTLAELILLSEYGQLHKANRLARRRLLLVIFQRKLRRWLILTDKPCLFQGVMLTSIQVKRLCNSLPTRLFRLISQGKPHRLFKPCGFFICDSQADLHSKYRVLPNTKERCKW